MHFAKVLQYPFQGKSWFSRILILALIQLVPIAGQTILVGYGLAVVRSVAAGKTDLPPLHGLRALGDGLRLLAAGLLYLLPVVAVALMILTTGTGQTGAGSDSGNSGAPLLIAGLALVVLPALSRATKRVPKLGAVVRVLGGVMMIVLVVTSVSSLSQILINMSISSLNLNAFGIVEFIVLLLIFLVIFVGLQAAGVRYAIQGSGLLQPTQTIRLMADNRRKTGMLIVNMILLDVLAILAIAVGLLLLVLPGLFLFVVFALAQWRLFALFGMQMGLHLTNQPNQKDLISTKELN